MRITIVLGCFTSSRAKNRLVFDLYKDQKQAQQAHVFFL
jgi:hypothetical protein